ncbi:MAG: diguanylate cyclase [Deltaproteobacteria bacterium]|nr:diguanylate cyclase [Deltaproteobacteria bacterium]
MKTVKELNLLHKIAALFCRSGLNLPDQLQSMILLFPSGWQYPEITAARLVYGQAEYRTPNFDTTPWTQTAEFKVGDTEGRIDVAYLEERPSSGDGPFLPKERRLIDYLAKILRIYLEYRETRHALKRAERNLRILTSSIPATVFKGFADWSVEFYDNKIEEMTGYSQIEFHSGKFKWCDIVSAADFPDARRVFIEALRSNKAYVRDYRIRDKSGQVKWIQERSCITLEENGRIKYILGIFFDITDRKLAAAELDKYRERLEELVEKRTYELITANQELRHVIARREEAQQALREQYIFLQAFMEAIPNPLFFKDTNFIYKECNSAFAAFLGLRKEEIKGKSVYDMASHDLANLYHEKDVELMANPGLQVYEARVPHADGTRHDVIFNKATFFHADGTLGGLVGAIVDITERKQMEKELQNAMTRLNVMAVTDELTSLYNRRFLFDRLKEEIGRTIRYKHFLSIIMIDIDHFKEVNDTYGHHVGDLVLQHVADILKAACRSHDTVVRYGGEEMIILAPETDRSGALALAQRIRESVEKHRVISDQGEEVRVTVSLGVGVFSCDQLAEIGCCDGVIKQADDALYLAKNAGRNRVEILARDYSGAAERPSEPIIECV